MKKKIVTLSLAIALIAILVGGSLAYFMDSDEVTNVFTIGSVEVELVEEQRVIDADGNFTTDLEEFKQQKQLIPVIDDTDVTSDVNFSDKIVTVKNTGENDAYIRVFVAVPATLVAEGKEILHIHSNGDGWSLDSTDYEPVTIEGVLCDVFSYTYDAALAGNGVISTDAIYGVYLDKETNIAENSSGEKVLIRGDYVSEFVASESINVHVAAQAIQAKGFADANAALESFATHPWVTE